MYKFSVIIPHYDLVIEDKQLESILLNLEAQAWSSSIEVLLYHDGPENRPCIDLSAYDINIKYKATKKRYNDWGHSLRDLGIKEATGEYIIHLNPDNELYPYAIDELLRLSRRQYPLEISNDILIFPIYMNGVCSNGKVIYRDRSGYKDPRMLFTGYPTMMYNIDCMQLVMKRSLWLVEGGWYDKREISDGIMYPKFVAKYGARYCDTTLGEHN